MAVSGPYWCIEGLVEGVTDWFISEAEPEDVAVHLFSDDQTIAATTVYADITLITTSGGEKITLVKGTYTAPTGADPSVLVYNSGIGLVWTFTGSLTIYGWALIGETTSKIYAAENFGVNTVSNGNTLTLQPWSLNFDIPA